MAPLLRRALLRGIGLLLALAAAALPLGCGGTPGGAAIVVAGEDTPEQRLLGEITLQLLREHGYGVVDRTAMGDARAVRAALERRRADLSWAYTGDTWTAHLGHHQPITEADEAFRRVCEEDAENGIAWLGPAPVQRRLTVVVGADLAEGGNVRSIEGLLWHRTTVDPRLRICAPAELQGGAGLQGLERVYGLRFDASSVHTVEIEEGYRALSGGECDCALGYSSDVALRRYGLYALADNRGFFAASNLALGARREVLDAHPELADLLRSLAERLTEQELHQAGTQVESGTLDLHAAARAFLRRNELMPR